MIVDVSGGYTPVNGPGLARYTLCHVGSRRRKLTGSDDGDEAQSESGY